MKEFRIGGKVIISEDESYRIVDIIKINEKTYYFACTENKPITPKVFEKIEEEGNIYIHIVENSEIIKDVLERVLKNNNA